VFNNEYTQYMPLPINELLSAVGQPALFVFDCCNAGHLLPHFASTDQSFAPYGVEPKNVPRASGVAVSSSGMASPPIPQSPSEHRHEWIVFAACGANETLPKLASLPADVFTACLTTPVKMALHWFVQVRDCLLRSTFCTCSVCCSLACSRS
jgi:regulator-associated protein of mTOR